MASPVGPLQHNVPIVDGGGRPTPLFMRLWAMLQGVGTTASDTAVTVGEVGEVVGELGSSLAGGAAGNILVKGSAADLDFQWTNTIDGGEI